MHAHTTTGLFPWRAVIDIGKNQTLEGAQTCYKLVDSVTVLC